MGCEISHRSTQILGYEAEVESLERLERWAYSIIQETSPTSPLCAMDDVKDSVAMF